MNWNDVQLFLTVASKQSLSKAADELKVSHTTAFRHLNKFEEAVGARLFDRNNGSYELTETGEELLVFAKNISNSFQDMDRFIFGKDKQAQGVVRLTVPTSFAYQIIPKYIQEFNQSYPDIRIDLLVTNQEENMKSRSADIALRVSKEPADYLFGRKICEINWGIFASEAYLKTYGNPKDLSELDGHHIIGAAGELLNHPSYHWLDGNYKNNIVQRSDDLAAISHLARIGIGLAFLPNDLKLPELTKCFTFNPAGLNDLWILTHPDLRKVERIKIVMGFFAERLKQDHTLFI
ncbi:LysR family transcriptional regulator [Curvivirga sp.]|uniref:LysR family transcriptional regulator n=1 Tax=Curvivirga sp. TaxID=2856848 RepID=UPI003B5C56CD